MRLTPVLAVLFLSGPASPQDSVGRSFTDKREIYSITLPDGWRQMTPVEARTLRAKMPRDVATLLNPGRTDRFGNIDRWLSHGFDGRCLTIECQDDGEPALTEETLRSVRETFRERSEAGPLRYTVRDLKLTTLATSTHKTIEWIVETADDTGVSFAQTLELLVPTGGRTLKFRFRAAPADFPAAEAVFRKCAATLVATQPPEGAKDLSDKLEMPLIIGGLVGLVLLVLYKLSKS